MRFRCTQGIDKTRRQRGATHGPKDSVHVVRLLGIPKCGFMLLFAVDQAAGTKLLMRESWTVVQGIVVVLIA